MLSIRTAAAAAMTLLFGALAAIPDFSVTTGNLSVWDQSDWSLTTLQYVPGHFQSRLSLANGYVGASVAAAGPFFERDANLSTTNGWPLFDERLSFSTISGFWNVQKNGTASNYPWLDQYGWDSFLSGIPHPTGIVFGFGSDWLDATVAKEKLSNFSSKISFKTGLTQWSYTWHPAGSSASFDVTFALIFSRVRPNVIAVKATIRASEDVNGTVTDLLDGRSAQRTYLEAKGTDRKKMIWSAVHPNGLANVTGWVASVADFPCKGSPRVATGPYVSPNESTIGQTFDISLEAGKDVTFYKYVGVASTDKFPDAVKTARETAKSAKNAGWDHLLDEHSAAWIELMADDKVDNFTDPVTGKLPTDPNVEILQVATVASTFYLLQNLQPEGSGLNDNSVSVGGLSSDSYAGLVFWDADTWMAPGLNLAYPSYAQQIANYRVKHHSQALRNAEFNGFPEGSSLYSWTSGRYSNCTATGPCVDYEYHLNHDITFNLLQLRNVTGNKKWFRSGADEVLLSTARMLGELLKWNETLGSYTIYNATDPDEYANMINSPAFTLASSKELLLRANEVLAERGDPVNDTWSHMVERIEIPRAKSGITIEFENMNNSAVIKQADVVLMMYPLGYDLNYSVSAQLLDLDYYSIRQSPDGPAMTYSVIAVAANAIAQSGCAAYTYTLQAFLPYLRGPWYQFSEQQIDDASINGGTNPAFPFHTGHGGAYQIAPFGFLGVRTDQAVLFISPSLPPQIPHVKMRAIHYGGATLMAVMNSTHTSLRRVASPDNLVDSYAGVSMPFVVGSPSNLTSQTYYTIRVDETILIPNRLYWQNETYPNGNILQCRPVTSPDRYVAGQIPISATDGAAATSWQPETNAPASLLIDTSATPSRLVSGIYFDFGQRPAAQATVRFFNGSKDASDGLSMFLPLGPTAMTPIGVEIVPVVGNTTTIPVAKNAGIWTGDWVELRVEGCAGCENESVGPTISEFVVY